MENIRNWRNPDPSVEARIRNTPKLNCLGKSVIVCRPSISMSLLIKTSNERLILSDERSRNFITGIEYRTKFMREVPNLIDLAKKYRPNSINQLPIEVKTRPGISHEQRTNKDKLEVKQRAKFKESSKSATQVSADRPKTFSQANLLRAKMAATKMPNESSNVSAKRRQPSPSMSGVSKERNAPSMNRPKRKIKNGKRKVSMKKTFYDGCYEAEAEKTSVLMTDLNDNERAAEAINRQELCIRLPNSPNSRDSSSLHTTPRSPRLGQKIIPISFIYDGNCNCPNDHDSLKDAMPISNTSRNSIVLHNSIPGPNKMKSTVFTVYLIPIFKWIEKDILADPEERNDVDNGLEIPISSWYVVDEKHQIYCTAGANLPHFLTAAPENPHNILSSFDRAFSRENLDDKKSNESTVNDETKPIEGLSRSCAMNTTKNTVTGPSCDFSNWERSETAIEAKDHSCHPSNFVPKQFTRPQSVSSTTVSQSFPNGKSKSRPAFEKKIDGKAKRPVSSPAIQGTGIIQYVRVNNRPIWK